MYQSIYDPISRGLGVSSFRPPQDNPGPQPLAAPAHYNGPIPLTAPRPSPILAISRHTMASAGISDVAFSPPSIDKARQHRRMGRPVQSMLSHRAQRAKYSTTSISSQQAAAYLAVGQTAGSATSRRDRHPAASQTSGPRSFARNMAFGKCFQGHRNGSSGAMVTSLWPFPIRRMRLGFVAADSMRPGDPTVSSVGFPRYRAIQSLYARLERHCH